MPKLFHWKKSVVLYLDAYSVQSSVYDGLNDRPLPIPEDLIPAVEDGSHVDVRIEFLTTGKTDPNRPDWSDLDGENRILLSVSLLVGDREISLPEDVQSDIWLHYEDLIDDAVVHTLGIMMMRMVR